MLVLRWLSAVVTLPGVVLGVVPALLLWATGGGDAAAPGSARFWAAVALALPGLWMAGWTASLFFRFGEGTAAPWDPPKKFVVRGPYRHVRNPMIISVFVMALAEAVYFRSAGILAWLATFLVGNLFYIPRVEEKGLEARFGEDYRRFVANVPRWVPRLRAWDGPPAP